MEKIIAVEKFHVFGTWSDGNPKHDYAVDTIVTLECRKSGAFQYGNGTCVGWTENGNTTVYDTRYEKFSANAKSFRQWAPAFVRSQVCKSLQVERLR